MSSPGSTIDGIDELLPPGEQILWRGQPQWRALAREAFHLRKFTIYFGVILALRAVFVITAGGGIGDALLSALWLVPLAAVGLGLIAGIAWLSARTTIYLFTTHRVVMRVGIALPITLNLPFVKIDAADLRLHAAGTGDIALALSGKRHLAYMIMWPHARPWHVTNPQPTLRALDDPQAIAKRLGEAWAAQTGATAARPELVRRPPQPSGSPSSTGSAVPA